MLAYCSSAVDLLMSNMSASRFDLITFAIGLVGYLILQSFRKDHEQKGVSKKLDAVLEEPSASFDYEYEETIAASEHLAKVLSSLDDSEATNHYLADMFECFFEDYPRYRFSTQEMQRILEFCSRAPARHLADTLFQRMQPTEDWTVLGAFIDFYASSQQSEKACNLYERHYATLFDVELDDQMLWKLLLAALKCGRHSLADHLLQTSACDMTKQVTTIQRWWKLKAVQLGEARVAHMGDVLNRLSNVFNARFPFEEHSDDESTAFFGDETDVDGASDSGVSHSDYSWDGEDDF